MALLDGLRRHAERAARTLRQRQWRKVVQLFVLLPVAPSMPPGRGAAAAPLSGAVGAVEGASGGNERRREGDGGETGRRGAGLPGPGAGAAVSGVSTVVDLPLPNNGDYSGEFCVVRRGWLAACLCCVCSVGLACA